VRQITAAVAAFLLLLTMATPAGAEESSDQPAIAVRLADSSALDRLVDQHDLEVISALVPSRGLYLVRPTDGTKKSGDLKKSAKKLSKDDDVAWAEVETDDDDPEDDRFHAWPQGTPIDPSSDPESWLKQDGLGYLRLDDVHQRATGEGVVVAILDTGVDFDHPHLQGHLASSGHFDYIDDDAVPQEEADGLDSNNDGHTDESYGHGTHAAGLVALVAPEARLVSYRVLDSDGVGNPYVVATAVNDAIDSGVDVINISFGMDGKPKSKVLKEAFKRAKKNNVVVVAAAGNRNTKSDHFPAQEKEVIGVAATRRGNDELAWFSNHGKPAMVAAPGEDIVSTLPGGGFGAWSGTSMATPIVAGQAALVRGVYPDVKLKKVTERVGKSSSKLKGKRKIEKGLIDILGSLDD
jgi:subtilisin family serine protease